MRCFVLSFLLALFLVSPTPAQHPIGPVQLSSIAAAQLVTMWDSQNDSIACLYGRVDGDSLIIVDSVPRFQVACSPRVIGWSIIGAVGFLRDESLSEDDAIDRMRLVLVHRQDWLLAGYVHTTAGFVGPDGTGQPIRLPQIWAAWRLSRRQPYHGQES